MKNSSIWGKNIKKIPSDIFDVRVSFILTKINKDDLTKVLDYARKLNIKEFRIGRYFPFRGAKKQQEKYELSDEKIKSILSAIDFSHYNFKIVPPIMDLKLMEKGYITINYLGEVFTPSQNGRNIYFNIGDETEKFSEFSHFINEQPKIFKNVILKR